MDFKQKHDASVVRIEANDALERLGLLKGTEGTYNVLKKLLGRDPNKAIGPTFTVEDYKLCLLLAGPHTYTIYKMLCLKHGLTELGNSGEEP